MEALEWINPKCFDRRASDYMTAELERIGVRVLLGEGIVSVEGNDRVSGVRTAKRAIPCDLVLWGIGMRPVVDLAVSMGAALGEHGGAVYKRQRFMWIPGAAWVAVPVRSHASWKTTCRRAPGIPW